MATVQTIKVILQRDSLQTPWGFRLQGGADFRTPFTVNKISAGSPADGHIHRGDVILEIDQKPISSMFHTDALNLIQHAGGQITFVLQRGANMAPHPSYSQQPQRPVSAMPWSYGHANPPWSASAHSLSPMSYFRNRPLERIPEPKPVLSQTGSPIMPGPVPCVSTKTRGYMQPPSFHTERYDSLMTNPYAPMRYMNPGGSYNNNNNNRNRTMSMAGHQTVQEPQPPQSSWRNSMISEPESYAPSYQKKVQINPNVQRQYYSPASPATPPSNLIHRQFNSPMSLYSSDNVQDVMNHHISHVNPLSQGDFTTDF